jgi:hypothetical protein
MTKGFPVTAFSKHKLEILGVGKKSLRYYDVSFVMNSINLQRDNEKNGNPRYSGIMIGIKEDDSITSAGMSILAS